MFVRITFGHFTPPPPPRQGTGAQEHVRSPGAISARSFSSIACASFRGLLTACGGRTGSRALRADAVESITCGWLAFVVVGALVGQLLISAWWVDPLASLGVVWFVIREGPVMDLRVERRLTDLTELHVPQDLDCVD